MRGFLFTVLAGTITERQKSYVEDSKLITFEVHDSHR